MDQDSIILQMQKAQQEGNPKKVYKKTIIGKVCVKLIDTFTGRNTERIIVGDPSTTPPEDLEVSLWTDLEVQYFEKYNRRLIESGTLALSNKSTQMKIDYSNAISDDQIKELLAKPYFTLVKTLAEITSETTLQRILNIAEGINRPAKTLNTIKERIEELQQHD